MSEFMMATFDWTGDTGVLRANYDAVLAHVVEVSPARPLIHLATATDTGFRVIDVWDNEQVARAMLDNPAFQAKLSEFGLGDPVLSVTPVHNLGWPVSDEPLYR